MLTVWLSGNVVGHVNEDALRRAGLVLRWVTVRDVLSWYLTKPPKPTQPGHPSVARQNEYEGNGEFCVTVGPVTRTADILT